MRETKQCGRWGIKLQKYNWPLMVRETMDAAFMPQSAMADRLKVSQQSISNWLNGTRNPGTEIKAELLKLAQDAGLDIRNYESNPDIDKITVYLKKNSGREFIRLLELYGRMGRVNKKKLMRYAEKH